MGRHIVHSSDAEFQVELEGERANTAELRRLVGQQAAALANLKRRRLVRAVLALDRYGQPLRRAIAERRRRLRMRLNQVELLTGAARNQGQLPERRATVAAAIERLAPARREPRRRSIVVVTDHPV